MHARTEDLLKIRDGEPVDAALRERVLACPHCSSELERLRRVKTALSELPELAPPPGVWERVAAEAIGESGAQRGGAPARRWQWGAASAAAVVTAVALGLLLQAPRGPELAPPAARELAPRVAAPGSAPSEPTPSAGAAGASAERATADGVGVEAASRGASSERAPAENAPAERAASERPLAEAAPNETAVSGPASAETRAESFASDPSARDRAVAGAGASEAPPARAGRDAPRPIGPLLTFHADTTAALTAGYSAAPRLELPPAYAELIVESARLERLLAALPPQRRLMSADTAGTIAALEDRIAWLDQQLSLAAAQGLEPRQRQPLWSERVEVMNALVQVRYGQAW